MGKIGLCRESLRELVSEQCSASFMNDTKWHRCLHEISEHKAQENVRTRLKLLTDPSVSDWGFFILPSEGYIEFFPNYGPVLFLEIEWLEIDIANLSAAFLDRLNPCFPAEGRPRLGDR